MIVLHINNLYQDKWRREELITTLTFNECLDFIL